MEYQYPLDLDWSNDEMVEVIKFFNQIENYYEKSIIGTELMEQYKNLNKLCQVKLKKNKFLKNLKKKWL